MVVVVAEHRTVVPTIQIDCRIPRDTSRVEVDRNGYWVVGRSNSGVESSRRTVVVVDTDPARRKHRTVVGGVDVLRRQPRMTVVVRNASYPWE